MACCLPAEARLAMQRSREIDKLLNRDRVILAREIKLLLLGAGECGKSTIVKQMKILYGTGYDDEERKSFIPLIHQNLMVSMKHMLEAMRIFGIALDNPELEEPAKKFLTDFSNMLEVAPIELFERLWRDPGIKAIFKRRNEYQLSDSTAYYMGSLSRIGEKTFLPNNHDILRARVPTTGIVEYSFKKGKLDFRMVDVGGQRSQRRKWIHCFQDVTSLIFITALSEYDQMLMEAEGTNRMRESLSLFKHIVREKWFKHCSVILFLNKIDLLRDKLKSQSTNITSFFPEYTGNPFDMDDIKKYFLDQFLEMKDHLYHHFTNATDSGNIDFVFQAVESTIMQDHLAAYHIA